VKVTDAEFCLRTARGLLRTRAERATVFINRVLGETVDPRLWNLDAPVLSMIAQNNFEAADRWIVRALEYERSRRAGRPPATTT
jgi:hypothetical protein